MIFSLAAGLMLEPPTFPHFEPVAGECPEAVEADPAVIGCRGVIVPTSYAAELLAWKVYGEGLADLYRIETTAMELQIADLTKPVPFSERAGVQRWSGRAEGVVLGVAIGAAVAFWAVR